MEESATIRAATGIVILLVVLSGCSVKQAPMTCPIPETHFRAMEVGMRRAQVDRSFGVTPRLVGEREFGKEKVEVFCYSIPPADDPGRARSPREYYLYFLDGRLGGWGHAGDWEAEADRIFRAAHR